MKMKIKNAKASVLVVTMIIMGLILVTSLSVSQTSLLERKSSINSNKSNVAYQMSDNGVERTLQSLKTKGSDAKVSSVDSDCDGIIENAAEGYEVELRSEDGTVMNATNISGYDCNTSTLASIKNIRSTGTAGQDKRSVEVTVSLGITAIGGVITYTDKDGKNPVPDTGIGNPWLVGYKVHTFTTDGTFKVLSGSGKVDYVVVGGGGGAGRSGIHYGGGEYYNTGGGGGAGGFQNGKLLVNVGDKTVKVGNGGAGGWSNGDVGSDSVFDSVTAKKGYGGGALGGNGGASGNDHPGGSGCNGYGGGGGGAIGGGGRICNNATYGGLGIANSISGSSVTYSNGGCTACGCDATLNTGNGGRGTYSISSPTPGCPGSPGIVIIRYPSLE